MKTANYKSEILDNIAFASAKNFKHTFPDHFHYEYSLAAAIEGVQYFNFSGKEVVVQPGSIVIIGPEQMHAHKPIANIGWSYKSMYISPDFIKSIQCKNKTNPNFNSLVINDKMIFNDYLKIFEKRFNPEEKQIVEFFQRVISIDKKHEIVESENLSLEVATDLKDYFAEHFSEKLNLEKLAKMVGIDKFKLIRLFRKLTGVTPNTYLTIVRLEKARKLINLHYPIVEVALESGFYDQSHFHHSFIHYTGITPGNYSRHFEEC